MWKELTVSLTPAFLMEGDWLLKAQLRCLAEQEFKDFTVLICDHHYNKRKAYMSELAEHYNLKIIHVPYSPATHHAKVLDCSVFNAPYCYSESPRIVRYSCWRFVKPDWTKLCLESSTNVDYFFHSCAAPNLDRYDYTTQHDSGIWDGKSDKVKWNNIPKHGEAGCTWSIHSETDAAAELFPKNCYGNYMVFRDQWLNINGTDEVFTNAMHYEDMDFVLRARNAGMTCERKALKLFRLHHQYGSHAGRANILPDVSFKKPCAACQAASSVIEPNRYDIKNRLAKDEIEIFDEHKVWVCKTCFLSGAVYHADCGEHTNWIESSGRIKATMLPKYRIGRNIAIVADDMNNKSLAEKFDIYTDSFTNPRYYEG
jgi:hypothetical protein